MFSRHAYDNPPPPFNPEFRPGLGEAVSKAYSEWSYAHPNHSHEDGREAYQRIHAELQPNYPSVG